MTIDRSLGSPEATIPLICVVSVSRFRRDKCCQFDEGNYIVTYPGELDAAEESGKSIQHLDIVGSYHGGYKVVCRAKDTSICDGGYKPLDCKSYPFFPTVSEAGWRKLAEQHPLIVDWLEKVRLVGYHRIEISPVRRQAHGTKRQQTGQGRSGCAADPAAPPWMLRPSIRGRMRRGWDEADR